jgi:glycosyltransferase involved in cell wall biosynthesis
MLSNLFSKLQNQANENLFTYSAVVVDNDAKQSAADVVADWVKVANFRIDYYCEPQQNIALARNKAVENARGNIYAFIDDDEFPEDTWLINLYNAYTKFKCDGVLGPVKPHFDRTPPSWLLKGKFCERESHKTGTILDWTLTRTGNVLINSNIFQERNIRFDPSFGLTGGEDQDFFKRMMNEGKIFVWCDEAVVFETVPPDRWKKGFYLKKYIQMGGRTGEIVRKWPLKLKFMWFIKSIILTSFYTIVLPLSVIGGQHVFMKCILKILYYINWFVGFFWRPIIKYRY